MAASRIELPVPAARVDDEREDHARAGHASPGERHESPGEHESSGAFLRRAEVRDVLAWMRLLADPHDAAAIVRALARPPIELHQVELARVIQVARRRKLGLVLGLAAATESPHIPPEARERIQRFLDLHASFAGELDVAAPDELLATLVRRLRAPARALLAARDAAEHDAGLERLQELAREFVREFPRASARELARHLATVAPGAGERRGANTGTPAPTTASSRSEGQAGTGGHAGAGSEARGGGVAGADGVAGVSGEAGAGGVAGAGGEAGTGGETGARADAADGERANGVGDEALDDQTAERELHDAFQLLREEVLDAVARIGGRLGELRLDTDLDISHGVARYLELLKVSAALQRPAGQSLADALADVNTRLLAAVTPLQREILQTSPLDAALVRAAEPGAPVAAGGEGASTLTPREQRSLTPFLPRRGTGLALSASDIHTYRSCPLRYKFARVLRIPLEQTVNQRFGIVVHQVLERYHREDGQTLELMLRLLEDCWRRAGFGRDGLDGDLREKALAALTRYHARLRAHDSKPVWFERQFHFRVGPHHLRGRVDRVDRLGDGADAEYELIDYKTSRPKTAEQLHADIQLSLYALAAREDWRLASSRQAYYYVLDDLKVPVAAGARDARSVEEIVLEVGEGILAERFDPTPSPATCAMCDYRITCPVARA